MLKTTYYHRKGVHGCYCVVVGFTTTYAGGTCELESRSGKVYSIQHYVIKFVSDLRQINGFLHIFWFVSSTNEIRYI